MLHFICMGKVEIVLQGLEMMMNLIVHQIGHLTMTFASVSMISNSVILFVSIQSNRILFNAESASTKTNTKTSWTQVDKAARNKQTTA